MYLLESPRGDHSYKKNKKKNICFITEKKVQKYPLFVLQTGHIKILHISKFNFTAKSLVTNTVVTARVLCTDASILLTQEKQKCHPLIPLYCIPNTSFADIYKQCKPSSDIV